MALIKGKQIKQNSISLDRFNLNAYTVGDAIAGVDPGKALINLDYLENEFSSAALDFENGLSFSTSGGTNRVALGGALTENTTISGAYELNFGGTAGDELTSMTVNTGFLDVITGPSYFGLWDNFIELIFEHGANGYGTFYSDDSWTEVGYRTGDSTQVGSLGLSPGSLELFQRTGVGRYTLLLDSDTGTATFQDTVNNRGLQYLTDYSTGWDDTAIFDTVLTPKAYVDREITALATDVAAAAFDFENGLIASTAGGENIVRLGGALTEADTYIAGAGNDIFWGLSEGTTDSNLGQFGIYTGAFTVRDGYNGGNMIALSNDVFEARAVNDAAVRGGSTVVISANSNANGVLGMGPVTTTLARAANYLSITDEAFTMVAGDVNIGLTTTSGIVTGGAGFAGLTYDAPYTFIDRSLVDKAYVDSVATGLDIKGSVRAATTVASGNIAGYTAGTIAGVGAALTLDGVALAAGDRVLVKNQTDPVENGIYTYDGTDTLVRSDDMDTDAEATAGSFTFVEEGTSHAGDGFVLLGVGDGTDVTLGTDPINWSQFAEATAYAAGHGINFDGANIEFDGAAIAGAGLTWVGGAGAETLAVDGVNLVGNGVDWNGTTFEIALEDFTSLAGTAGTEEYIPVYNNTDGQLYVDVSDIDANAAGDVNQIQLHGADGKLAANANFTWDATNRRLNVGPNNTLNAGVMNVIFGNDNAITAGSWNFMSAELSTIANGNNNQLFGLSNTITGASNFANFVMGEGNTLSITTGRNLSTFLGGKGNEINANNHNNMGSVALGNATLVTGQNGFAHGHSVGVTTDGAGNILYTSPQILAAGTHAINMSANDTGQGAGNGALGDFSGIFAGVNHHIDAAADRSVILGGTGITATAADTVYVPNLNIDTAPAAAGTAGFDFMVRDAANGSILSLSGTTFNDLIDIDYENGIHEDGNTVRLGGPLTQHSVFAGGGYQVFFGGTGDGATGVTGLDAVSYFGAYTTMSQIITPVTNNYQKSLTITGTTSQIDSLQTFDNGANYYGAYVNASDGAVVNARVNTVDNGANSDITLGLNDVRITATNAAAAIYQLQFTDTAATFTDTHATPAGLQYAADYSATYTARSLVDRGYVDTEISGAVTSAAFDYENGLTASTAGGNVVRLGGALTQNTDISGAYVFNLGTAASSLTSLNTYVTTSISANFPTDVNGNQSSLYHDPTMWTVDLYDATANNGNYFFGTNSGNITVDEADNSGINISWSGGFLGLQAEHTDGTIYDLTLDHGNAGGRAIFTDTRNTRGLQYAADYSLNWADTVAFDTVLTPKAYVDREVASAVANSVINAENGLTLDAGTAGQGIITLGGALTEDTAITATGFRFDVTGASGMNLTTVGALTLSSGANSTFTDTAGVGLSYAGNYAATWDNTAPYNNVLVTKAYVDAVVGSAATALAGNGLQVISDQLALGDTLSDNVVFDGANAYSFTFTDMSAHTTHVDTGGTLTSEVNQTTTGVELRALDGGVQQARLMVRSGGPTSLEALLNLRLESTDGQVVINSSDPIRLNQVAEYNTDYHGQYTDRSLVDKAYVDSLAAGFDVKLAARVSTQADLGLAYAAGVFTGATGTIDGIALANGDRILVRAQTDATQNGIYVYDATGGTYVRAADMDGTPANEFTVGNFVFVAEGTDAGDGFVIIATGTAGGGILTPDVDDIIWSRFSDATAYVGGFGININGATLDLDVADFTEGYMGTSGVGLLNVKHDNADQLVMEVADIRNSVAAGTTFQIQYNNNGALAASQRLSYNEAKNNFRAGATMTITDAANVDNYQIFGNDGILESAGGNLRWTFSAGEALAFRNLHATNVVHNSFGVGGYDNELRVAADGRSIYNSGFIGGALNEISTGATNAADVRGATIIGGRQHFLHADLSAIIGGIGNIVAPTAAGSVILGGGGITAVTADTVYVPSLNIDTVPDASTSGDVTILTRNATTGQVETTTADDIMGLIVPGADNQIIFNDGGNFGASANLSFDNANNRFNMGAGNTITAGTEQTAIGYGITISGGSWNFVTAGDSDITGNVRDSTITGYDHTISGHIENSLIGGSNHTIDNAGGVWNAFIMGTLNTYTNDTANVTSVTMIGTDLLLDVNDPEHSMLFGYRAESRALGGVAFGYTTTAGAPRVLTGGIHAFNLSTNTAAQVANQGAMANYSGIFGGQDHHIDTAAVNSIILGGSGITATDADTVYVPNLNIVEATDTYAGTAGLGALLVQDEVTGHVQSVVEGHGITLEGGEIIVDLDDVAVATGAAPDAGEIPVNYNTDGKLVISAQDVNNLTPVETRIIFDADVDIAMGATAYLPYFGTQTNTVDWTKLQGMPHIYINGVKYDQLGVALQKAVYFAPAGGGPTRAELPSATNNQLWINTNNLDFGIDGPASGDPDRIEVVFTVTV